MVQNAELATRVASSPQQSGAAVEALAKLFRGLGDPTRIQIIDLLLEEERCVSELVDLLGATQSRVSSHLACLRWCGYVASERVGQRVFYRVADPRVRSLVETARLVLADNAEAIASCTRIPDPR